MPAPSATAAATSTASTTFISQSIGSIQSGDILIASGAIVGLQTWVCTDTMGNTWFPASPPYSEGGFKINDGFAQVAIFYAYANGAGSTTVTLTGNFTKDFHAIVLAVYPREDRNFDQMALSVGPGVSVSDPPYTNVLNSSGFNISDTLVVSTLASLGGFTGSLGSNTGDTLRITALNGSSKELSLFDRTESSSASAENVQLKTNWSTSQISMCVLTFSKVLAKSGLTRYHAVRGGAGFDNNELPGTAPYWPWNRPLTVTSPCAPLVGSTVFVFAAGVTSTPLTCSDAYGNVYTNLLNDTVGGACVSVFSAPVTVLPAAGASFQVQIDQTIPGSGAVYQVMGAGISVVDETVTDVEAVGYLSATEPVVGTVRLTSVTINDVAAGKYLLAFAFYPSANVQDSLDWSALDSYTIRQEWNLIQGPFQQTNARRLGPCVVFDKLAPANGNYNATIDGVMTGNLGVQGRIVLLAMALSSEPPELCVVFPITTPEPSLAAYTEPVERQGS